MATVGLHNSAHAISIRHDEAPEVVEKVTEAAMQPSRYVDVKVRKKMRVVGHCCVGEDHFRTRGKAGKLREAERLMGCLQASRFEQNGSDDGKRYSRPTI